MSGDDLGLYARMGAVCDVYDAITSNRPYKAGWCPADSLRRMAEWDSERGTPTVAMTVQCVAALVLVLLLRPQGIMGKRQR